MRTINTGDALAACVEPGSVAKLLAAMASGQTGFSVRCTPRRRTVMAEIPALGVIFAKIRRGRRCDATAEWRWLHELPRLGLQVPKPIGFFREGRLSVVATAAVAGRGLDALLRAVHTEQERAAALRFVCQVVAPLIRALHRHGLVFRDLYWNHLFAASLACRSVTFLDVERVFRPRFRMRRWRVKDLAGLLASAPDPLPRTAALRFLSCYLCSDERPCAAQIARDVVKKAAQIRAHQPRYG
jgi:hypothetical protein